MSHKKNITLFMSAFFVQLYYFLGVILYLLFHLFLISWFHLSLFVFIVYSHFSYIPHLLFRLMVLLSYFPDIIFLSVQNLHTHKLKTFSILCLPVFFPTKSKEASNRKRNQIKADFRDTIQIALCL